VLHGYIVAGATKLMMYEPSRLLRATMFPNVWSEDGLKLAYLQATQKHHPMVWTTVTLTVAWLHY